MAFKILDSVLKGIAAIIPKLRETIHKDRRDEDDA